MQKSETNPRVSNRQYQSLFNAIIDGLIITDLETGLVIEANPAAYMMHGYTRDNFIGLPLEDLVHKESKKTFNEEILKSRTDGRLDIRVQHVSQDGTIFIAEWRGTEFAFHGKTCMLSLIRDVGDRHHAEQLLHKRAETRTHEQETLLAISQTLASTLQLQPDLILKQLQEIIEYSHGGLFVVENSSLVTLAMSGMPFPELSLPLHIHLQGPEILTRMFSDKLPVRIADVWNDTPNAEFLRSLLEDRAAVLLEGMHSWMWVPLTVKNRILGAIGVAHENPNHYTPHHARLALSVANQAAITMVNAELYEQAQELAALDERQRLARNLHDAVNQSLFSAAIIAEVLPRIWKQDRDLAQQSLLDLRRLTRSAQAEMRALLAELRPSTLTDSKLDELLLLLGNALSGRIDIPVEVTAPEDVILPSKVQVAFYRVCQEALNNIAKHAEANRVEIHLTQEGAVFEMRIRDDGQGFETDEVPTGHYGLEMMSERAEAVEAKLSVTSQPGYGTELTVCWTDPAYKDL
jgi:two-component system nitrate/nitrite sensor histidine kinase NarX